MGGLGLLVDAGFLHDEFVFVVGFPAVVEEDGAGGAEVVESAGAGVGFKVLFLSVEEFDEYDEVTSVEGES